MSLRCERSRGAIFGGLLLIVVPTGAVRADTHTITDLDPTRVYDVVVEGTTHIGGLQPSPEGVLTFDMPLTGGVQLVETGLGDVTPPSDVSNLVAASPAATSVHLLWSAVGDDGMQGTATGYQIAWSTSPSGLGSGANYAQSPPVPAPPGTLQSFRLRRLPAETTLHAAIRTRDDAGRWSGLSNVVSFTTTSLPAGPPPDGPSPDDPPGDPGDTTIPSPVDDLMALAPAVTTVLLAWTAVGDDGGSGTAYAYDLRYATGPIDPESYDDATRYSAVPAPGTAGEIEAVTIFGLAPVTRYYFALVVVDDAGNRSSVSNTATATTGSGDTAPLLPPAAPQATYSAGVVTLSWSAASGAVGYHVYRREEGGSEGRLTSSPLPQPGFADDTVIAEHAYWYRLTAVASDLSESPASAEIWIRAAAVPAALAIERVYPNPIRGEAVFRFLIPEVGPSASGTRVTLDLYDVAGRRVGRVVDDVFPPGVQEVRWSPASSGRAFAPGLYVSVIRAGGRSARSPVAIAR